MNSERYEDRQLARDREYARAWEKLTPAQRRQFAKSGIKGPELPVYRTGKHDEEALIERAGEPMEADTTEESPGRLSDADLLAALRRVVGEMLSSDNVRLTLECLSLVTGIDYAGESMTAIARRLGVTRAAVSKRCVEITRAMNLPPSRAMRRLTARTAYERRAHECHSRHTH